MSTSFFFWRNSYIHTRAWSTTHSWEVHRGLKVYLVHFMFLRLFSTRWQLCFAVLVTVLARVRAHIYSVLWVLHRNTAPAFLSSHTQAIIACNGSVGYIETRHVSDTWKCGSLSFIFTHPPEDNRTSNLTNEEMSVGTWHNSTRVDEGGKSWNLVAIKMLLQL